MGDCSNSVTKYIVVEPISDFGHFSGLTVCGGGGITVDFISGCTSDGVNGGGGIFNDGVLRKDIFQSGLAKIFFEKYQDQLKPFFEEKLKKIQNYSPFVHFNDSSISASSIWSQYIPRLSKVLNELQSKK